MGTVFRCFAKVNTTTFSWFCVIMRLIFRHCRGLWIPSCCPPYSQVSKYGIRVWRGCDKSCRSNPSKLLGVGLLTPFCMTNLEGSCHHATCMPQHTLLTKSSCLTSSIFPSHRERHEHGCIMSLMHPLLLHLQSGFLKCTLRSYSNQAAKLWTQPAHCRATCLGICSNQVAEQDHWAN